MKVLIVSRWMWEEHRRNPGAPGFFAELALAVADRGVELTILSQADDAGPIPEPRSFHVLDVHVFSREKRRTLLAPLDKVAKLWCGYRKAVTDAAVIRDFVRKHGPFDAVVAQCEEPDGVACALGLPKDVPLITFVHDLRYRFRADGVRFIRKWSLGRTFCRSTRVVANSEQTASWLESEYGVQEEKIGQCRIHLTAPFLERAAQMREHPVAPEKRVLFLGALNRKKAPHVFLCAAMALAEHRPDWKFVLVGAETEEDRPYQIVLRNLVGDVKLRDRVEMLGRLEPDGVMEQIQRARVVVCPSRIETFSRTTIEALALGRPVIVTETTGAAAWVKKTGMGSVTGPGAGALAQAINEWMTREVPVPASAGITSELTAARAAEDWVREIETALGRR